MASLAPAARAAPPVDAAAPGVRHRHHRLDVGIAAFAIVSLLGTGRSSGSRSSGVLLSWLSLGVGPDRLEALGGVAMVAVVS